MKKFIIATILLVTSLTFFASAQESKFKALFIYKFAEYVEWPSNPSTLTVGIIGSTDVFKELSSFAANKGGMEVIKINSASEASKCNMIFIPSSESGTIDQFQSSTASKSILVVADDSSLVTKGADIGFFMDAGKLRFKINKNSIESKNMIPSSKLLQLGQSIN
ncbi:MAG: YfiR family protein [Reichenbachiella sp.]